MKLRIRAHLESSYPDVFTFHAMDILASMSRFNENQKNLMSKRLHRRSQRAANKEKVSFLDADDNIAGTDIRVQDARDGKFISSEIPADLQRQWIQGTGPAAKPMHPRKKASAM